MEPERIIWNDVSSGKWALVRKGVEWKDIAWDVDQWKAVVDTKNSGFSAMRGGS
jgi:hypothetical protein